MSTATVNSVDLDKIAADYKKAYQNVKRRIIICGGTGCVANGSLDVRDALAKELEKAGIDVILEVKAEDRKKEDTYISKSGCQGFCQMGPLLHIEPGDILYTKVKIADVPEIVEEVKKLIGKKPIFGICLGHQLLALAMGAKTYKLKFGHRGTNQPVKDLRTGNVYISSQNHGYAVDEESFKDLPLTVTHINVNDGTVEGMRHNTLPIFSVQYHPEAAPGPDDNMYLFDEFWAMLKKGE